MERQERIRNAGIASVVAGMVVALVLTLGTAATAQFSISEAELFFELNDTDGDLGLHAAIDGDPWVKLEIEGPDGMLLTVTAQGRAARQGLTQLNLESSELPFDELTPAQFFRRFREGLYEIELTNRAGEQVEATVRLSQVMAAPAVLRSNGALLGDCGGGGSPQVTAGESVPIDWEPITLSHPTIGKNPNQPLGAIGIARYQFFFEQGDVKLSVDLLPNVTEFEVPGAITGMMVPGEAKVEVIVRTGELNNTAVEKCVTIVVQ